VAKDGNSYRRGRQNDRWQKKTRPTGPKTVPILYSIPRSFTIRGFFVALSIVFKEHTFLTMKKRRKNRQKERRKNFILQNRKQKEVPSCKKKGKMIK